MIEVEDADVFEIKNGKIKGLRISWDEIGIQRQLDPAPNWSGRAWRRRSR